MDAVPARRRGEIAPRAAGRRGIDREAEFHGILTLHHLYLPVSTFQLRANVASSRVASITQSDLLCDKPALRPEVDGDPVDDSRAAKLLSRLAKFVFR